LYGQQRSSSGLCEGVLAAVLHFEGAEYLGPDPGALEKLYQ
jgi:microsomal dipeptidase-like Zn-dependent dipeptidase